MNVVRAVMASIFLAQPDLSGAVQSPTAPTLRLDEEWSRKILDPSGVPVGDAGSMAMDGGGLIYLAIPSELRILVLKPDGTAATAFGGKGAGPGEFSHIALLYRFGDTVVVADPSLRRLSFLRTAGTPGVARVVATDRPFFPLVGRRALVEPPLLASRVMRDSLTPWPLLLTNLDDASEDTLLPRRAPRQAVVLRRSNGSIGVVRTERLSDFDDTPLWRVAPGARHVLLVQRPLGSREGRYQVTLIKSTGDTVYSKSIGSSPVEVPRHVANDVVDELARVVQNEFGSLEHARRAVADAYRVPPTYPPVTDAFVSEDSVVWLRGAPSPSGVVWTLLRPDGSVLGTVRANESESIRLAVGGTAWSVRTSQDGDMTLHRFKLVR